MSSAWTKEVDTGRLRSGGNYVLLREATAATDNKTLSFANVLTLFPNARGLHVEGVFLDVDTDATVGPRGILWTLYPTVASGVIRRGYQFAYQPDANEELWITASVGLTEGAVQSPLAATSVGAAWDGYQTLAAPWPPDIVLVQAMTLHFELSNNGTDDLFVSLWCNVL